MEKLKQRKLNNLKIFVAFYMCTIILEVYVNM